MKLTPPMLFCVYSRVRRYFTLQSRVTAIITQSIRAIGVTILNSASVNRFIPRMERLSPARWLTVQRRYRIDCSESRFRPRYCHDLESSESARSGELTSRLLTWRSRDRYPIVFQVSRRTCLYEGITLVDRSVGRSGKANQCASQSAGQAGGNVSPCPCFVRLRILVACAIDLFPLPSLSLRRVTSPAF